MKQYDNKGQQSTSTRVELESRESQTSGNGLETLTPLEEKVVRMLHGLSERDDKELEFAVGASRDARMRLALMEAHNVAEAGGEVPLGSDASREALERIVARYSGN